MSDQQSDADRPYTTTLDDNRPSVYREEKDWIFRASSFGHCLRALLLAARGFFPAPFPAGIVQAFKDGQLWEAWLVEYMRRGKDVADVSSDFLSNWSIYGQQREYNLQLIPGFKLRVHIDALGKRFGPIAGPSEFPDSEGLDSSFHPLNNREFVVEYKSFADTLMTKWASDLDLANLYTYAVQISIEMIATGLPCLVVVADKTTANINDPDADPEIYYHIIEEPPISRADLTKRLMAIRKYLTDPNLQGEFPDCDVEDSWYCQFYGYHDKKLSTGGVDNQIAGLIERWEQLGGDIKILQTERDDVKELLAKVVAVDSPVTANGKTFGFYTQVRKKWDTEGMAAVIHELAPEVDLDQFVTETTSTTTRYS